MKSFLRASLRVASPSPQDTVFPATRFNAFRTYAMLMGSNRLTFCILGASLVFLRLRGRRIKFRARNGLPSGSSVPKRHGSRKPSTLLVSACCFASPRLGFLARSPCLRSPSGLLGLAWLASGLSAFGLLARSVASARPSLIDTIHLRRP